MSSHDVATSMSYYEQGTSPMTPQLPSNEPSSLHDEHVPRLERLLSFICLIYVCSVYVKVYLSFTCVLRKVIQNLLFVIAVFTATELG